MAKTSLKTYNYNSNVRDLLARHGKLPGEVGIEIECEGKNLPGQNHLEKFWVTHADGSLRGESIEYVMNGPVPRKDVIPALTYLEDLFKENKTKIKDSYRTSVHVHINMQSVSICQTYNTVLLYGIVEDILTEYAGSSRVGNLFCLRMSDAEFMLHELRQGAVSDRYDHLNNNTLRYAGCNVKSLFDHNSLEFRAFRGTSDMKLIAEWVDIILQIKDAALTYENPSLMLQNFSNLGPEGFLKKNFNPSLCKLIMSFNKWQDRIFAGVRLVQDVAYANDWAKTPEKSEATGKKATKLSYYEMEVHNMGDAGVGDDGIQAMRDMIAQQRQVLNPIIEVAPLRGERLRGRPVGNWGVNVDAPHAGEGEPVPPADWPAAMDEEI